MRTLKSLRVFLGIIGYYRKFVCNYGKIASPLTNLLIKNTFVWNKVADQAFLTLNIAMLSTPILVVLVFTKPFILECGSLGIGLGEILT